MKSRPRLKALAYSVSLAVAQLVSSSAYADTAIGVDTAMGNTLNPPGRPAVPRLTQTDPDIIATVRHSPNGQMYGIPLKDEATTRTASGWDYSAGIEAGLLGGDAGKKSGLYRKYKDLKNGLYLNYFETEAQNNATASYVQAFGGGTGMHDQFYTAQFGRYNDWKVKLFYNETQHVFTDTYKQIYNGSGTGNLTLAGGLKPNGGAAFYTSLTAPALVPVLAPACAPGALCISYTGPTGVQQNYANPTAANLASINWTGAGGVAPAPIAANSIAGSINTYLKTVPDSELAIVRKKGGAMAEIKFTNTWKGYASYTQERRTGARPYAMTENNYNVEIPEPIDYVTHDFLTGLSYSDSLTQANLRASGSLFRNNISTLTVQQPWLSTQTSLGAVQTAIFDLYPDNDAFNLKGEFARSLPDFYKGRFTANASWGTSRQNDALMLPFDPTQSAQIFNATGSYLLQGVAPIGVANPGYLGNTLDLRNWDGTNGWPLSQATANQRIDTKMLNFGLSLKPVDELDLKGDVRYYATTNKGGYIAYNPLTGQFGRGFVRSTSFDLVVGSAGAPGAVGGACYNLPGFPVVPGCTFNGNAGIVAVAPAFSQSANNPSNVPVFSNPRDNQQLNYTLTADYDLGKGGSLNGALEREDIRRTFRERDKTWENKFKIGYVNRGFEAATLRVSYEEGSRRGSTYNFWPVGDFGTGLPGLDWNTILTQYLKAVAPAGWTTSTAATAALRNVAGYFANRYNLGSRKYDLADRNQQMINTRVNYMPRSDIDLGVTFQRKDTIYPNSGYGLEKEKMTSLNLDVNYQPSSEQLISGYYTRQDTSKTQRASSGFTAAGIAPTTCAALAGAVLTVDQFVAQCAANFWLPSAMWNMNTRDKNDVLGLSFQTDVRTMKFGLDYTYSESKTSMNYNYGGGTAVAVAVPQLGLGAFPDMTLVQNTLTARLMVPIEKMTSAHLMYRHESGRVKDWHYDNLPIGASAAENQATLFLDAGAQNYHTNVYGVMFLLKL